MQRDTYTEIVRILSNAGIEDAELEARWIAEDIPDAQKAIAAAHRRAAHEPLQYLLGNWEFYGLRLAVGEGVLIPRADTETLVDAVLSRLRQQKPRIVDLCTGSGCIALALHAHLHDAQVTGIELSPEALRYARINANAHGAAVTLRQADVLDANTAADFTALDAVVSNPPYLTADDMANLQPEVTHEPTLALDGGTDGLQFYRALTRLWADTLKPGGLLAYEVGIGQAAAVSDILRKNGLTRVETVWDFNGIERVVLGYKV